MQVKGLKNWFMDFVVYILVFHLIFQQNLRLLRSVSETKYIL